MLGCLEVSSIPILWGGEDEYLPMMERLGRYVEAVVRSKLQGLDKVFSSRQAALCYQIFQSLCGGSWVVFAAPSKLLSRLRKAGCTDETQERELVWTHLAFGDTTEVEQLLLFDPNKAGPPAASSSFGFNLQGFQRHLTQTLVHRSSIDSVEHAWHDFLDAFPRLRGADLVQITDLLLVAHAVYYGIGGHDSKELLPWLQAQLP